jgi:hypothetical protein
LSATQVFEILAVIAIVVAVAAGAGLALVYRRLQRYLRNQHVIMGSRGTVDIVDHVSAMDDKLANVRLALEDLALAARDHDVRIDTCLSRVGIVRFDAYQDLGGRQSTAVAFLNSTGDGVVVTTVVSRDFARMYVKLLKEGAADIPLAPEEAEAVEQAKGSGPFTIRPRAGGGIRLRQRARSRPSLRTSRCRWAFPDVVPRTTGKSRARIAGANVRGYPPSRIGWCPRPWAGAIPEPPLLPATPSKAWQISTFLSARLSAGAPMAKTGLPS